MLSVRRRAGRRLAAAGVVALACLAVTGCDRDTPQARFDDYLSRLARTLDEPLPAPAPFALAPYPERRVLLQPVTTPRTGWLGLLQLHRCGLVNLISERNSILGRVAPPQRRLAYESKMLAGLIACRRPLDDADADDAEFRARLDRLIAIKRRAWPRIYWNRSWASPALAGLFSRAAGDAGLQPTAAGQATRHALAGLAAVADARMQGRPLKAATLADFYQAIEARPYGGQLQVAARDAIVMLDRAATLLERRLQRRPLCFKQRANRRARVLQTILMDVYGTRVQSYLADLRRAARQLNAVTETLIAAQPLDPLPPAFVAYRRAVLGERSRLWQRFDQALARHTDLWQQAMRQCGLMPGG